MRRSLIASALIVLMSTPVMAAQVYKWVDAQGVTHFGAQPPEGQQATSVNTTIAPAPTAAPAKLPQVGVDEEQQAIDEKVKKEVAAKEAERKQYCEKMRTNLAQLENNPRLREEVNGEARRLGEDERQKRIAEAKKAIAENCQ
ncbi:hypothetical protein HNP49_003630 [Pseudomonas fluvialis]|uniref:DUF4124 domain-containing protein n=1 Tax=Pseudomonas fluvialis TaxID=1793966 RepID=A0A7X0ETI3_9PSED|nr:DUF4124 domain-containing protein [Pseudomonas fluvialis]MBB6343428.1 hypothetical protein [Pseudomonas fluvialis]